LKNLLVEWIMDLSSIEKKIKALLERCKQLEQKNLHLENRCRHLEHTHSEVTHKAKRLLKHLKTLHKD